MFSVTFINHATVLISLGGVNILTDPVYSRTVSFILPRLQQPGIPLDELPRIDIVAISHNHYDHLNLSTLRRIYRKFQPTIIVPAGVSKYAVRTGYSKIREMNWRDSAMLGNVKVSCVQAQHFSGRTLWDRNASVYCGYVFESDGGSVYFCGDSGYANFFTTIGEQFSIDTALLPIGAYSPRRWFKSIHMNPEEAVQTFLDVKAKHLVPIHWGTFKISDEPMSEPPVRLQKAASDAGLSDNVHILQNGEQFSWER